MKELGKGLVRQPVWSSALVGTTVLGLAAGGITDTSLISKMAAGKTVVAPAWGDIFGSRAADVHRSALPAATRAGDSWSITGRVDMVPDAPLAQLMLVVAADGNNQTGLYLVDRGEVGLSARDFSL